MITLVPIYRIIQVISENPVLQVDATTIELNPIVRVTLDLDVLHRCAGAHTNQRNTIDLVALTEFITSFSNDDILQNAAAV